MAKNEQARQEITEIKGEEAEQQPRDLPKLPQGIPLRTWFVVILSSAGFHALLLILLAFIFIDEPKNDTEKITIGITGEEKEEKVIPRKEFDIDVDEKTAAQGANVALKKRSQFQNELSQTVNLRSKANNSRPAERTLALGEISGIGRFGRPGGGKAFESGGDTSGATRKSVLEALEWLAKHQSGDGGWDADAYDKFCPNGQQCEVFINEGQFDVGVTGLSLLAFLGAGFTPESDEQLGEIDVGTVVRDGLYWLKNRQRNNGAFGTGDKEIYNHAIATMVYAEAYGITGAPRLKGVAQKGVEFLEKAQNTSSGELLGWRYKPNSGKSDTSVTGWCAMAIKSAEHAGLDTSGKSLQGAMRWVEQNTNDRGITGYTSKINSLSKAHKRRAMTPVGMLIRTFVHKKLRPDQSQRLKQGADFLINRLPEWREEKRRMDFYYWYHGSLALYEFAGPNTPFRDTGYWQKWNKRMKSALLTGQQTDQEGHETGSWDPVSRWGEQGGRVYTTAINTLTLEVCYRYNTALFH